MPWGTARGGGPGRASLPELQRGGRDRRLEQPGRRTGRNGDATSLPVRGGAVDLDSGVDDRRGPCGHLGADKVDAGPAGPCPIGEHPRSGVPGLG